MDWSGVAGGTANIMRVPVGIEEDSEDNPIKTYSETYSNSDGR